MQYVITASAGPALGDIRGLGAGDTVWLREGVTGRRDWSRYVDALVSALTRGAEVRWLR